MTYYVYRTNLMLQQIPMNTESSNVINPVYYDNLYDGYNGYWYDYPWYLWSYPRYYGGYYNSHGRGDYHHRGGGHRGGYHGGHH